MSLKANVIALSQSKTPTNVLTQPLEAAKKAYKQWRKFEDDTRTEREIKVRTALAKAYAFAETALANKPEFDALKNTLGVNSRSGTSDYHDVIKCAFGEWQLDGMGNPDKWLTLSDSQIYKYARVMDFASFKKIGADKFNGWLNKDGNKDTSINKRLTEANNDEDYAKDCKKRKVFGGTTPPMAITLTPEQEAMIKQRVLEQHTLEEVPETTGMQVVLRHVYESGMVEYYELPAKVADAQKFLNGVLSIDDSNVPFKRLFRLLELASLIRVAKNEKGPVLRLDFDKQSSTTIAHNGLRGSIRIDAGFDTEDTDIPSLKTHLNHDAIKYISELWKNFKGEWKFDPPNTLIVTPPGGATVSAHLKAINAKRKAAWDEVKKKNPKKKGDWTPFELPKQFNRPRDKTVVVPLSGWVKPADVKLTQLQSSITFLPQVITLSKELVKKIIDTEKDVLEMKHPTLKTKKGDPEPRIKGNMINLRISAQRMSFCDLDSQIVSHVDIPKISDEPFRKDYYLFKRDLSKTLKGLQSLFKDYAVKIEMADTFLRFSIDGGSGRASVIVPVGINSNQYNSTAFQYEKLPAPQAVEEPSDTAAIAS